MQDLSSNIEPLLERYGKDSPPDPAVLFALTNDIRTGANIYAFQKTVEGAFSLDVYFDSGSMPSKLDCTLLARTSLTRPAAGLSAGLRAARDAFDDRFEATFGLSAKGFDAPAIETARQLTASIIGGIGYFYGSSIADRSFTFSYDDPELALSNDGGSARDPDPQLTAPGELYTATPSRSFFPRGFYWCVACAFASTTPSSQGRGLPSALDRGLGQRSQPGDPSGLGQPDRRERLGRSGADPG